MVVRVYSAVAHDLGASRAAVCLLYKLFEFVKLKILIGCHQTKTETSSKFISVIPKISALGIMSTFSDARCKFSNRWFVTIDCLIRRDASCDGH